MKMRTKNPSQRVLDVEWGPCEWTPRIVYRSSWEIDRRRTNFEIVPDSSILLAKKPLKRRGMLGIRREVTRPTWR